MSHKMSGEGTTSRREADDPQGRLRLLHGLVVGLAVKCTARVKHTQAILAELHSAADPDEVEVARVAGLLAAYEQDLRDIQTTLAEAERLIGITVEK